MLCAASVVLGEGPLWDPDLRVLYWLDNVSGTIYRFDPGTGMQRSVGVGQPLGSFALTDRRDQVLLTGERGISLFDWNTLREYPLHPLPRPDPSAVPSMPSDVSPGFSRGLRFNEGAVDAAGRFIAGTYEMDEPHGEGQAETYSFEATSDPDPAKPQIILKRTLIARVWISNGIGFNEDSSRMYFIDSMTRAVVAYKYDLGSGALGDEGTTIIRFPVQWGVPDGLSVDAEGMIWVASFGGYRVSRWDPNTGRQLDEILLPTGQIPSLTFMGEDLRDLVIVSGARGAGLLDREPLAGSVFIVRGMNVAGKPAPRFKGAIAVDESKAVQRKIIEETTLVITDLP